MHTADELTLMIEALQEYYLRVSGHPARKFLCEALIYRLKLDLVSQVEADLKGTNEQ